VLFLNNAFKFQVDDKGQFGPGATTVSIIDISFLTIFVSDATGWPRPVQMFPIPRAEHCQPEKDELKTRKTCRRLKPSANHSATF
jgi:hypothetical protein